MKTYAIKQEMGLTDIQDRFVAMGRGDNFSREGLESILQYLEDVAVCDAGGQTNAFTLDVISICCEFTESPLRQFIWDYGLEEADFTYGDGIEADMLLAYAEDHTWVVLLENGNILYANF